MIMAPDASAIASAVSIGASGRRSRSSEDGAGAPIWIVESSVASGRPARVTATRSCQRAASGSVTVAW